MKFFWNLACELYTALIRIGFKIPPSHRFFNQTAIPPDEIFEEIIEIHADISFPEWERYYILQAAKDFEYFSNDQFIFEITFDLDPSDQEFIKDHSVILRVDKTHPIIAETDGYYKHNTLGLCQFRGEYNSIYMVHDRLHNPNAYRTTMIHELGHFVGMEHTEPLGLMYKHISPQVLYPTYVDAVEFCRIYECKPEYLRYFKLK